MRDEVLIKRQLVAMVTWILANKRVREKCLLGDGKKRESRERREGRQTERSCRARRTVPGQSNQTERLHVVFLSPCIQREETQVTTVISLCSPKLNMLLSVGY